jgi:hypothetical protein
MSKELNKRHAERLWHSAQRLRGPAISGWYVIGPAMLIVAIIACVWMDVAELTPILTLVLWMVCCLGFLMWMYDGFFRLLDEKEAEIGRLRTQLAHGDPGHTEKRRS